MSPSNLRHVQTRPLPSQAGWGINVCHQSDGVSKSPQGASDALLPSRCPLLSRVVDSGVVSALPRARTAVLDEKHQPMVKKMHVHQVVQAKVVEKQTSSSAPTLPRVSGLPFQTRTIGIVPHWQANAAVYPSVEVINTGDEIICGVRELFNGEANASRSYRFIAELPEDLRQLSDPNSNQFKTAIKLSSAALGLAPQTRYGLYRSWSMALTS